MRTLLSALWVFVTLNYLYADVLGLMDARVLAGYLSGQVDSLRITRELLLGAAVLMEIPIAMTVLARVLPYRWNRWANVASGLIKTIAVGASLTVGDPAPSYCFFAAIELACTTLIVVLAWRWRA